MKKLILFLFLTILSSCSKKNLDNEEYTNCYTYIYLNKVNGIIETLSQNQKDEEEFLSEKFKVMCTEDTNIIELSLSYLDYDKGKELIARPIFDYDIFYHPAKLANSRFYQKKGNFIYSKEYSRRLTTKYKDEQIKFFYPLDNVINNKVELDTNHTIITQEEEGIRKIIYEEPFINYRIILYREEKPNLKIKLLVEVPLDYKNEIWCWKNNQNIKKTML